MIKIVFAIMLIISAGVYAQQADTLKVFQNDTTVFDSILVPPRPCSKPRLEYAFRLKKPKDNVYYLIYNAKGQLVKEGLYTASYVVNDITYGGGFYNAKYYDYKNKGKCWRISYQVDGRNTKVEYYKKGKLKEVKSISD